MGTVNRTFVTIFDEFGQAATVVDVGVGQDHAIDFFRVELPLRIKILHFFIVALIKTAIQQNGKSVVQGDEVGASRYFLCSSAKFNFHGFVLSEVIRGDRLVLVAGNYKTTRETGK